FGCLKGGLVGCLGRFVPQRYRASLQSGGPRLVTRIVPLAYSTDGDGSRCCLCGKGDRGEPYEAQSSWLRATAVWPHMVYAVRAIRSLRNPAYSLITTSLINWRRATTLSLRSILEELQEFSSPLLSNTIDHIDSTPAY